MGGFIAVLRRSRTQIIDISYRVYLSGPSTKKKDPPWDQEIEHRLAKMGTHTHTHTHIYTEAKELTPTQVFQTANRCLLVFLTAQQQLPSPAAK